jgi:L-lactate dehydrogenase (cytochrome)
VRNGLTVPPEIKIRNVIDIMTKPLWALSILQGKRKTFGNLAGHVKGMENVNSLAQWTASQFDPTLNWKDVEWVKSIWPGKLILKGVLDVDDAKIAVTTGADAISVSNHGGRQLDGVISTARALPAIADAVGDRTILLADGGVRSGLDVVRMLALGARGVLLGRAWAYALAGAGERGVAHLLELMAAEMRVAMALTGCTRIADIDRNILVREER